ncbi:NAD(P)/FAD-dependent oxidoreductase [Pseudomonas sp. MYb185]|uniref:NAD(P)/FAD-dependent oxidoreductase n=1 Tax=Pseudomonas sp. MYb185 TaxID=1848729 RepID=UPI000CFE29BA|nr:FAD/NAD(P)-binding oxidoreductase [Pseudomonas sp. MYb185]PRB82680.1 pyridine nucleotide-disulfide oxidoreductase [Pseudomonas sp. MYb185]
MSYNDNNSLTRRRFLQLGTLGTGALLLPLSTANAAPQKFRSSARIVIVGAGAAGLALASRLTASLEGADITLVDARREHFYQPGFTLVAAGIKPVDYPVSRTADYVPEGVRLVVEPVAEIDPESNRVTTESALRLDYDFLFVACGMQLDYAAIDGMDVRRIGSNGMGSIYHSPQGAHATWLEMSRFADRGGVAVLQRPDTEMKCAGAPLKYTFIVEDYLTRRGTRAHSQVIYNSNNQALFSVPIVSEKVRMLYRERNIQMNYDRTLQAIDLDRRIATFSSPQGKVQLEYDFINVIPPMKAPDVVRNSPLPWQTGAWANEGWMEVDRGTLRHVRYPNVFGIGDIAGVPKGKTAASVKWQVPVAIEHLLADISDKPTDALYTGYTSCPLITRLGQAMLIEFDYENNLMPSFPGLVAPPEELWVSWVMKTMGLKPTYISMLRGRA